MKKDFEYFSLVIEKLTSESLMTRALQVTGGQGKKTNLQQIYRNQHSPIRTQIFWIEMIGIPSFVSVHFVRHSIGITHFVQSNRDDVKKVNLISEYTDIAQKTVEMRAGNQEINRNTPINHAMLINAEALINMSHKRLCNKAHYKTRMVMQGIKDLLLEVDTDLYPELQPLCFYRNGLCSEGKPCGKNGIGASFVKDVQDRIAQGKENYGVFLGKESTNNPLNSLYEELIDAAMYIKQEINK